MAADNIIIPATGAGGTANPTVECATIAGDGSARQVVQIGGFGSNSTPVAIATGNGVTNTGTQRVTLASDSPAALPTGAATSALQTTINTTLGSPFQAGASIGNTSFASTQSGTWNIGTVTTLTGITPAFGATGSNVPASGGYQGLRGTTANPTSVTDGQLVGAMGDKKGRIVAVLNSVRDLVGQQTTTITASTSETTIVTAVNGVLLDVVAFNFSNTGASATAVSIRDTTGGSVLRTFMVPAGDMRGQTYTVPIPQTTANTNWTAQCGTSTSSLIATVDYVKNTA